MTTAGGGTQGYLVPLSVLWGEDNLRFGAPKLSWTMARIRTGSRLGAILDGSYDERFMRDLLAAIRKGEDIPAEGGTIRITATPALAALDLDGTIRSVGVEQSNVSAIANDQAIVKVYRRLRGGTLRAAPSSPCPRRGPARGPDAFCSLGHANLPDPRVSGAVVRS